MAAKLTLSQRRIISGRKQGRKNSLRSNIVCKKLKRTKRVMLKTVEQVIASAELAQELSRSPEDFL